MTISPVWRLTWTWGTHLYLDSDVALRSCQSPTAAGNDADFRRRIRDSLRRIREAKVVTGQRPQGGSRYFWAAMSESPEPANVPSLPERSNGISSKWTGTARSWMSSSAPATYGMGGHATCIMGIVPFFSLHFWRAFGHHSTSNGFGAMSSSFQAKQSPFGI